MNLLRSIIMAFSVFSRIPMPTLEWKEHNLRYILAALPLIGSVIGLILWGWIELCNLLGIGTMFLSAGVTLIPVAVTGGIHLDGFADTIDALASHAPMQRKREIIEDPHTGAFAVIYLAGYFIAYFALCTELERVWQSALLLGLIHCLSRILGGLSSLCLVSASSDELLETFVLASRRASVVLLIIQLGVVAAGAVLYNMTQGIVIILTASLCFVYTAVMSKREFGGMNGDIAGHLIQLSELCMFASAILAQKAVSLWF